MKRRKVLNIVIAVAAGVVLFVIVHYCVKYRGLFLWEVKTVMITSADSKDTIYIKRLARGLNGSRMVMTISKCDDIPFYPDSQSEFVYPGAWYFLYKIANDTLTIYIRRAAPTPPHFSSKITVRQVELNNPEMMNLWSDQEKLGFKSF